MDTVGATGAEDGLFAPRVVGGRLYGRGACDTKGSVAAMLTALLAVARHGARPRETEIVFAGLVDEENGQAGSRALAGTGLRADLAVVGEPTRLQVVTAHKGDLWLRLETDGRAAHGSTPHLGQSAVRAMARAVTVLEGSYAARIARRRHRLLGTPTVNVGTIQGGTQPNVVPAQCRISIDRRTVPGETEASVRRELRAELKRRGVAARLVNLRAAPCPAMETDARLPWVRRFLELARQPRPVGVHYFCDAAILAQAGIPSVVFGPGDIAQAHTAGEWIALSSLQAGTDLLERFMRSLP
jgi:acetylornithine deacetylase/succinyl-diaminopimelate desuccinylase-like protein